MTDPLLNISPLDGRYAKKNDLLRPYVSEFGLIRYRLKVEVEWFIYICNTLTLEGTRKWSEGEVKQLREIYEKFSVDAGLEVKNIEKTTNHDVKAVEYFIKECFKNTAYQPYQEFIHFACTSEDINNLAYALMVKESLQQVIQPMVKDIADIFFTMAQQNKSLPMMARTHGQPASPTTLGKECINILARIEEQGSKLFKVAHYGKINGAVGNFNAHLAAYPNRDWIKASKDFITSLGLTPRLYTTQIEPHDGLAELCDAMKRLNTVLIDVAQDIWLYISFGYFRQAVKQGEVGSSTMPHKVNPIDFENAEGNLKIANVLLEHFSLKLPISRMQRDLTDSTTLRNIGSAFAYTLIAFESLKNGLGKLKVNEKAFERDLAQTWELLAEPIQTVLRAHKVEGAYEKLKELTRGTAITQEDLQRFIETLEIPDKAKEQLKSLTPSKYTGLATELVESYKRLEI